MNVRKITAVVLAAGVSAGIALPIMAQQRAASGPVARYDMRAGTISGVGAMGQMNVMSMMLGGGKSDNVQRELHLRLGSSNVPTGGAPNAAHFMPPSAKLGKSVALVTPREEKAPDGFPSEKPKGRLLLYWGCGEHALAGQPVVIDFSKLVAGQVPAGLWSNNIPLDWGPTLQNSKTFGRWPAEDGKYAKPDSSLIGPHRIAANYSPEISFTLTKDFMAPLSVRATPNASGSTLLGWTGIANATGYLAFVFGGKQGPNNQMGDMVMWTSSASRQFGGGLSDWLTPSQVTRLVGDRTVMSPSATSCVVPAEVKRDAPDFRFGTLTAFGPEEDFSYPPRPADAKAAWNLEWTARVRHRSTTSWMDAQGMSMGAGQAQQGSAQEGQDKKCKPKGLKGMLGGAIGLPTGC
jgi:hypothetical protein